MSNSSNHQETPNKLEAQLYDYAVHRIEQLIEKGLIKSWRSLAKKAGVHENIHERFINKKNMNIYTFVRIIDATGLSWNVFFKDFRKSWGLRSHKNRKVDNHGK